MPRDHKVPPSIIVEAGTRSDPFISGIGISRENSLPMIRLEHSSSINFKAWGENPAHISADVNLPNLAQLRISPPSFIRVGVDRQILDMTGSSRTHIVTYSELNYNSNPNLYSLSDGGIVVSEAGTYECAVRLSPSHPERTLIETSLQLLVNGIPTGLIDRVYNYNLQSINNHILIQPIILAAGDIVTVQIYMEFTLVGATFVELNAGYITLNRSGTIISN